MHAPLHASWFALQHRPAVHVSPMLQVVLQSPQWVGSVFVSMHSLPQTERPFAHFLRQPPALHSWSGAHLVAHLPQLSLSVCRSTQF